MVWITCSAKLQSRIGGCATSKACDLQRAVVADTGAPTLANHVQHDKDQIGGKFCCHICRIWDPIVCILILDAPELGDIKHQKKLVFQPSDSWEHHPRGYGRRTNNRRSVILSNFQTISLHFFERDDNSKGIEHIELQKMEDSSFFRFRTESKAQIHGE